MKHHLTTQGLFERKLLDTLAETCVEIQKRREGKTLLDETSSLLRNINKNSMQMEENTAPPSLKM
jgi:ribosomal protein S19E (S16A)